MGSFDVVTITAITVSKVLLCSAVGLFVSKKFEAPEKSLKGLSAISLIIFLPCLLFGNLVLRVTWKALQDFYWAPVLSSLPMALGYSFSLLFRLFLNREWHAVLSLGCTFQNGLTFPLSLLLSLKGISWLTPEAVDRGQSYIFLYNILCSVGLWAIGEPIIKSSKRKMLQRRAERRAKLEDEQRRREKDALTAMQHSFIVYPYEQRGLSRVMEAPGVEFPTQVEVSNAPPPRMANVREQLRWYRPSRVGAQPISLAGPQTESSPVWEGCRRAFNTLKSPSIASTVAAIIISLVPPLRVLAVTPPADVIIGGMKIIGSGAIPLQLLVLGCNVASAGAKPKKPTLAGAGSVSAGKKNEKDVDDEDEEDAADIPLDNAAYIKVTFVRQSTLFIILTVVLRLVLVPFVCLILIILLRKTGIVPTERVFLLSVLLGTCAPTAINSSLICSMHGYKTRPYASMIFVMYIASVASTVVWLSIYIWYLGG